MNHNSVDCKKIWHHTTCLKKREDPIIRNDYQTILHVKECIKCKNKYTSESDEYLKKLRKVEVNRQI